MQLFLYQLYLPMQSIFNLIKNRLNVSKNTIYQIISLLFFEENMKKLILFALVSGAMSTSAMAVDMGHGKINFTGNIISSPCSIDPESDEQTVELGKITDTTLLGGGKSSPQTFDVALTNCNSATLSKGVQLTFTGSPADFDTSNQTLGIVGTASGAGVQITNGAGQVVKLGEASPFQMIQDGKNTLRFAAYVIGDGDNVKVGEFSSVANFTLNYE